MLTLKLLPNQTLTQTQTITSTLILTPKKANKKSADEYLTVVKYEPSLYFRQLCDSSMSMRVFSSSLRSKLFPRSSPNPNQCTMRGARERARSHTSCRDSEIKLTAYT